MHYTACVHDNVSQGSALILGVFKGLQRAITLTPLVVKYHKRKFLAIVITFDQLEHIMCRYQEAGRTLFTILCPCFGVVMMMK